MHNEFAPLPVKCCLEDDESGYGFLMRSARANGMLLGELFTYAGCRSIKWPLSKEIESLAYLTSVSPSSLARHMRQRQACDRTIFFCGQRWRGNEMFRLKVPQICALCIRELHRCLAVWEISAYCVCSRHQTLLIDRCMHCKRPLSWLRPALDVCSCRRYISDPNADSVLTQADQILELSRWLEGLLVPNTTLKCALPTWLKSLEGDGVLHTLRAFGWRKHAGERISLSDAVKVLSPQEMFSCLQRAFLRLKSLSSDGSLPRPVADLLDEARLNRLSASGLSEPARGHARQLLKSMQLKPSLDQLRRPWFTARPAKGQLELFDYA